MNKPATVDAPMSMVGLAYLMTSSNIAALRRRDVEGLGQGFAARGPTQSPDVEIKTFGEYLNLLGHPSSARKSTQTHACFANNPSFSNT